MARGSQFDWPSPAKVKKLYAQLGTKTKVAEKLGVSPSAVQHFCSRHGITPPKAKRDVVKQAQAVSEKTHEPTASEQELARKVITAERGRATARAEARVAKRQVKEAETERDQLEVALALATKTENTPSPDWLRSPKKGRIHRGTLVAAWSDFHIGEAVDAGEMNGYNAYDPDIAEMRTRRFFERTILVARDYLAGVKYDGIVMPNLGDTISGDIHDEFRQTNELSNFEAVPLAVAWLEEGIGMFADAFGKVHVPCVPGNHPRDSRKPRYKKRSAHNADTLISKLVAQKFKDDDRVTFDIPAGLTADFSVYETKFRIEHGDEAKGGGGIQGAMLPLALHTHKARKQAQAEGAPFDILFMGHWHQLMFLVGKGFIINGAGKGYDEYARGKKFDPEPPQQALMVVTPEHGITAQLPVFVQSRNEVW